MESYEDKVARIQKFRPIDDTFFEVIAQDPSVSEEILRTVLEDPGLEVVEVQAQRSIKNLFGRSVRLDALCRMGTGALANIEIQRSDNDNHLKRVRYNASCITASAVDPGDKFEQVPTVYAVYISEFDPFGFGFTAYHVDNIIRETSTLADDGFHRIFVNAKTDDGTDTARLMKCFLQKEVDDPKFPRMSKRVHLLKHSEGGLRIMCAVMEEYAKEYAKEYAEEYAKESDKQTARYLFQNGASLELVKLSMRNLSGEEIQEIYESVHKGCPV